MPERIFALFADIPAERERVRRMFRDAGIFKPLEMPAPALVHKIESPNEDWAEPVHGKRWLASRRLIVRPRVYAALKLLKLRGIRWLPARVE